MTFNPLTAAVSGVQELLPYVPGKPIEELARELGLDPAGIIKLASNENPLGPSPKVLAAIQAALPELTRYPDGSGFVLKQALAEHYQCAVGQITLGNGSNDILDLVARAWLGPGCTAVFSQFAFAVYAIATQAVGAQGRSVPAQAFGHDLEAMLAAIDARTRVVFLANPNNPTGTCCTTAALADFLSRVPTEVLVVLDEAYIEYAEDEALPNGLGFLAQYSNLLVVRTFSKAYGLAGLRVGYSISSPAIAEVLNRVRQPFNVSSLALVAARAALADGAYLSASRRLNTQGLRQLELGLASLELTWIPSKGNFLAVRCPHAAAINQALLERGVIVRPLQGYGLPDFLRISVGTTEENARFLAVLSDILAHG